MKKKSDNNVFYASELEVLNMSGLYAENIQKATINRFGQMEYAQSTSQGQGASSGQITTHGTATGHGST